jgi:hypothetical protein
MGKIASNPILPLLEGYTADDLEARFWSQMKTDPNSGCWIWGAGRNGSRYGGLTIGGKNIRAHRLSLVLSTGQDRPDMMALHSCDNPLCCNPKHLRWGTAFENTHDALNRGRFNVGDRTGENNPKAKLTIADVEKIRSVHKPGVTGYATIAKQFGVAKRTIKDVILRRTWAS